MLECWGLGRTLRWGVVGNRRRCLGACVTSRYDPFPPFDLLLLHCDGAMCSMQLVVESCELELVIADGSIRQHL